MTAKELSEACDEDKASVSRSVDYLEENGYLIGAKKGTKRYKTPLELTEKGIEVAKRLSKTIDSILSESSAGLSPEELDTVYRGLNVIMENLQRICERYGE